MALACLVLWMGVGPIPQAVEEEVPNCLWVSFFSNHCLQTIPSPDVPFAVSLSAHS
jgi:hypothetical protein